MRKESMFACILLLCALPAQQVLGAPVTCGGINTVLFSNGDTTLSICHGSYTKYDLSRLAHWQDCGDAMIMLRNKKSRAITDYAECSPMAEEQLRLRGHVFSLRHFYSEATSDKMHPLAIENLNLLTKQKSYRFEKMFPRCTRSAVDAARRSIDATVAKPFDHRTYFKAVYGGFYKLRDCAQSQPDYVLSVLENYERSGKFDGEVAETLGQVVDEVSVIVAAARQIRHGRTKN